MTANTLDPVLAAAIRQELIATGTKTGSLVRQQRRIRVVAALVGGVALVGAVTGAALIVAALPGQTITAPVGTAVTATHTGTASIDLGPAPHNASVVILDITCLSAGTYTVPLRITGPEEGASVSADCTKTGIGHTTHINDGLLPAEGSTSITITADPGTSWKATARYASRATSAWGVNANGQTYGVGNDNGLPDLEAAQATNGKVGYIYSKELLRSQSSSRYLDVYESDGVTVIGKFPIGNHGEWTYTTSHEPSSGNSAPASGDDQ